MEKVDPDSFEARICSSRRLNGRLNFCRHEQGFGEATANVKIEKHAPIGGALFKVDHQLPAEAMAIFDAEHIYFEVDPDATSEANGCGTKAK